MSGGTLRISFWGVGPPYSVVGDAGEAVRAVKDRRGDSGFDQVREHRDRSGVVEHAGEGLLLSSARRGGDGQRVD